MIIPVMARRLYRVFRNKKLINITKIGLVLARKETIAGFSDKLIARKNADIEISSDIPIKNRIRLDLIGS